MSTDLLSWSNDPALARQPWKSCSTRIPVATRSYRVGSGVLCSIGIGLYQPTIKWLNCLGLTLIRFRSNPMFAGRYESCMEAESQVGFTSIRSPNWPSTPHTRLQNYHSPRILNPQKSRQPTLPHKITQEPIFYTLQDSENPKCLIILATISTLVIIRIL